MINFYVFKVYTYTVIFGLLFVAELIINQITHSLVILSDCYFNMYVWMNLVLSIISLRISNSVSLRATFGWARIEVLGALFNIIFTLALSFSIFVEGILNLIHSSHHKSETNKPWTLIIPGIISLIMNLCRALFFTENYGPKNVHFSIDGEQVQVNCIVNRAEDETLELKVVKPLIISTKSLKAVDENELKNDLSETKSGPCCVAFNKSCKCLSELLRIFKAIGTALLLIAGPSSLFYAHPECFELIDPICGLIGIVIILSVIFPSLKESGSILLQTAPKHVEVSQLEKSLHKEFPEIIHIHDLHIWCLTRDKIIVTCHINLPPLTTEAYKLLSNRIVNFFQAQGISMVTIQPEFREMINTVSQKCMYTCT